MNTRLNYEQSKQAARAFITDEQRWREWHAVDSIRCHGLAQTGQRCGQLAKRHTEYCYLHGNQDYDPAAEG